MLAVCRRCCSKALDALKSPSSKLITVPFSGTLPPFSTLSKVVLPEPDTPMTAVIAPCGTDRSMPRNTDIPPRRTSTSWRVIAGLLCIGFGHLSCGEQTLSARRRHVGLVRDPHTLGILSDVDRLDDLPLRNGDHRNRIADAIAHISRFVAVIGDDPVRLIADPDRGNQIEFGDRIDGGVATRRRDRDQMLLVGSEDHPVIERVR